MKAKRVFILGAGFSAAMGLPTLRELFPSIFTYAENAGTSEEVTHVISGLQHLYPHFRPKSTHRSYPPFEEFLSLVVAAEPHPGYEPDYWPRIRKSAVRLLTNFMASKAKQAERAPLLAAFTDRLEPGDVVITFNWDNLVERSLAAQQKQVNFLRRAASEVTVLKLHGSLNWASVPEQAKIVHEDTGKIGWIDENLCYRLDYAYFDQWTSLDEPPFITLPVSAKRPLETPALHRIWHEAFSSLIEGIPTSVIGYSLPPEDLQARSLFTSAVMMKKEYRVVDPDSTVGARYFKYVGPRLRFFQSGFTAELMDELFGSATDRGD